jgi:IS605 OrfB family transposase
MKKKKLRNKNLKLKRDSFLKKFIDVIKENKNNVPRFIKCKSYKQEEINTDSWFDITKNINKTKREPVVAETDELTKCEYKQIKVKMIMSDIHKQVFQNWFKATTLIYNETLKYIRQNYVFTKKEIVSDILRAEIKKSKKFYNKFYIRNQMNQLKKQVQKSTNMIIDKKYTKDKLSNIKCKIDIHTLDNTIFQLVQNINASVTNMLRRNIKRFRLKFWKYTRPSKIIELEKIKIVDGILCKSIFEKLEDIKYIYNGEPYNISQVDTDFKINYNSITNEYHLLVSVKIDNNEVNNNNNGKLIILDPGLRTFMTGLSDNEHLNIGTNVHSKIKSYITRLNKIKNNENIPLKIKNKNEKMINKKITDKVDDLHWKTINYLVGNYETIFLGDMSAKSIVKKHNSVLSNESKVACLRTRYYDFQLRLKYKCSVNNKKFKLVNEYYTSKTCSLCGNYNKNLGGNKIYKCTNCCRSLDRDINGCRNIYMKHFLKETN